MRRKSSHTEFVTAASRCTCTRRTQETAKYVPLRPLPTWLGPIADFDAIKIQLASVKKIRSWSHGEGRQA